MSAVAPEVTELSPEQSTALDALKVSFSKGYRKAQKAMASVATSIVDLRMTFMKDGKPDYRGDTPEYRAAIGQVYEELLADESERSNFKQAIRYWISKEFMARVQDGRLNSSELVESGIRKPARKKAAAKEKAPAASQDGDGGAAKNVQIENGVATRNGKQLAPKAVRKLVENVTTEYLAEIGPVTLLRSVTSELKALLEALDDPNASINPESSVFRGAVKNLLVVSQSLAEKSGVATMTEPVAAAATAESEVGNRLTRRSAADKKEKSAGKTAGKTPDAAPQEELSSISWPS